MDQKNSYAGAVALITGGASGIGKALGEALAQRGAEVLLADRQVDEAEAVAAGIRERGGAARAVELDVRDTAAFAAVVADLVERAGHIDYFFNNAGIGVGGEVAQYEQRDWDDVLDVNLRGVTHGIQAVYPVMVAQGHGHIVNTASMAGLLPMPGGAAYNASKHAVVGLSKAMRVEASFHGVRVSALCPGAIRTPILEGGRYGRLDHVAGVGEAALREKWERLRPMDPRDFAEEVLAQVARNEPYIIVPRWWRAFWWLERLAPELSLRASRTMHARMRELLRPKESERESRDAESSASARG